VASSATTTTANGVTARRPATPTEESRSVVLLGDGHQAPHEADAAQGVDLDRVSLVGARVLQDLDSGQEQHDAEDEERDVEPGDRRGADSDEAAAEDQRADDSVEQCPLLQRARYAARGEQDHEHEEVVDAQRLLDEVAGQVLHAAVGAVLLPHPHGEQQRQRDVEGRPADRLLGRDVVRPASYHEVERQQPDHGCDRDRPQRRGGDGFDGGGAGGSQRVRHGVLLRRSMVYV
jgi:hypothetical protein